MAGINISEQVVPSLTCSFDPANQSSVIVYTADWWVTPIATTTSPQ
jgi:hypothetical protein